MNNYLKLYCVYRALNKLIAKSLNIRRDKTIEHYLLFNIKNFQMYQAKADSALTKELNERKEEREQRICKRSKGYLIHYNDEFSFKDLNYIICRTMVDYFILDDEQIIESTINSFDNYFNKRYVENKIEKLKEMFLDKSKIIIQKRVAI